MPESVTTRHALPNLYVGQAQKEVTHNVALARIDALLHPVVEDSLATPPAGLTLASDGLCWLISAGATGQWSGRSGQLARWSGGSWRYINAVEGMTIWHKIRGLRLFYIGASWIVPTAIADPATGSVMDIEARATIVSILGYMRQISVLPV